MADGKNLLLIKSMATPPASTIHHGAQDLEMTACTPVILSLRVNNRATHTWTVLLLAIRILIGHIQIAHVRITPIRIHPELRSQDLMVHGRVVVARDTQGLTIARSNRPRAQVSLTAELLAVKKSNIANS